MGAHSEQRFHARCEATREQEIGTRPSAPYTLAGEHHALTESTILANRLSPRSVPPLPHSRLHAVSPRGSPSPELDSPLEEAVEELISAACNLEDVQVGI